MDNMISVAHFKKRLVDLFVRSQQERLPKKFEDRHIILKSVIMMLDQDCDYTEREINAAIARWLTTVGRYLSVDVLSIRRELVDRKYLMRDKRGICYQVHKDGFGNSLFVSEVRNVDVLAAIEEGRAEVEARKQLFVQQQPQMNRPGDSGGSKL